MLLPTVERHLAEKASSITAFTTLTSLLEALGFDVETSKQSLSLLAILPNPTLVEMEGTTSCSLHAMAFRRIVLS